MQAIETKYIAPTNHKGTRIRATCAAKTVIFNWNDELDVEANHVCAALKLVSPSYLNWLNDNITLKTGCLKSGNYVHVLVERGA